MIDRIKIYVAGPLSIGNKYSNVDKAIKIGDDILRMGYYPYIPHLNFFWHMQHPKSPIQWLDLDTAFLELCQGLFRITGESKGADEEEIIARKCGIPVFYTLEELRYYPWEI